MEIYGEYLFIENFITGVVILNITAKICGVSPKKRRLVLGGVLCGLYSFSIFYSFSSYFASLGSKGLFAIVLSILVFEKLSIVSIVKGIHTNKKLEWRKAAVRTFKIVLTIYIISFLMGGITIAIMYAMNIQGIANSGSVYMEGVSYMNIAMGVTVSYICGSLFSEFIKRRGIEEKIYKDVTIFFEVKSFNIRGLVDTGNFLKDPIMGRPVVIANNKVIENILENYHKGENAETLIQKKFPERVCLIPYNSVGKDKGLLWGVRVDSIRVQGRIWEQVIVGVYEGNTQAAHKKDYDVLLSREMLEGGIIANG